MIALLIASLFLTNPSPLNMPRAQAYSVKEGEAQWLEEKYSRFDLWMSRASLGRWEDDDGRVFMIYRLDVKIPAVNADETLTRVQYTQQCVKLQKKEKDDVRDAVEALSPCAISPRARPPRQMPRGFRDVDYWQESTNMTAIVCSFLPEKSEIWYLATWELVEGDNIYECMGKFEEEFLKDEFLSGKLAVWSPNLMGLGEREMLRFDAKNSITNYPSWRATDSADFTVLDNIAAGGESFVASFTNELPTLRKAFAEAMPTPIDGSNILCVARIYATRDEYLDAVGDVDGDDLSWSAAYWNVERRELVAHLPAGGWNELAKTMRHESFHQYLSYALSMFAAAPWLNEGYAQYFEDQTCMAWGVEYEPLTIETIDRLAESLPAIFAMDYEKFYEGTDAERRLKYRLAWSIACFLEKGAPKIRLQPFNDLKRDYVKCLLATHDMRKATFAAIGNEDRLKLFVREWKKFWKQNM